MAVPTRMDEPQTVPQNPNMDIGQDKFARIVRAIRLWMTIMLWAVVGISFGLSIYSANVLQGRISKNNDELAIFKSRSEIIPSFPFTPGPFDAAFTQRFNEVCTTGMRRMNQPGGFTWARNCPEISRTYEWRISNPVERNLMCRAFQAYTGSAAGDETTVWGRCDLQEEIDSCIFKVGQVDATGSSSSSECINSEVDAAATSLINSNAAIATQQATNSGLSLQDALSGTTSTGASSGTQVVNAQVTGQLNSPYAPLWYESSGSASMNAGWTNNDYYGNRVG